MFMKAAVTKFLDEAEIALVRGEAGDTGLLETYFNLLGFLRVLDLCDERYAVTYEIELGRLRLLCLDPSTLLFDTVKRAGSAVFFSATQTPLEFHREALGGQPEDPLLKLSSPFPPENLLVLVQDQIATSFRARAGSRDAVVEAVAAMVKQRVGNYMVFFPSYAYMAETSERFRSAYPEYDCRIQSAGMSELERDAFLGCFQDAAARTLVAFAVLGGIFGEGIDLVGDRLIGVAVVGVGLPQISVERDLIRESVQATGRSGFDHAYTFPGMNRVLQAVGRVIRTERDRGVILLIDERFRKPTYRRLFPAWWMIRSVRSPAEVALAAGAFWNSPFPCPSRPLL
jgi:DNA excision repair protein ERCC-2